LLIKDQQRQDESSLIIKIMRQPAKPVAASGFWAGDQPGAGEMQMIKKPVPAATRHTNTKNIEFLVFYNLTTHHSKLVTAWLEMHRPGSRP
jgi:hypothetical protein